MMLPAPKSQQKPIVFVVDDDISVRESLELLIKFAGWQPEMFALHLAVKTGGVTKVSF